jgi:hypothetical protein
VSRPPEPITHGTPGGYMAHRRRGEEACAACKKGWRAYYQKRNGGKPLAIKMRDRRRAAAEKKEQDRKAVQELRRLIE